jgi:hypothetical protein
VEGFGPVLRGSIAIGIERRWLRLLRARVAIPKQAGKEISLDGKRLPPCRGNIESAGSPELVDGNQVWAIRIERPRCDELKDGI